jgi:hypothetical protein
MLARLSAQGRQEVREGILALYRHARTAVEGTTYNPTPHDVINRTAAYTANLVILLAMCEEGGIAISDLCRDSEGPTIESMVRLWRSGLDIEAENSLFSQLKRKGGQIVVVDHGAIYLPISEANLIGDATAEAVLKAGFDTWGVLASADTPPHSTRFQRELNRATLALIVNRWKNPELGSLSDLDKDSYYAIADQIVAAKESPTAVTARLLALQLAYDQARLDPALVEQLVHLICAGRELIEIAQPMISYFALQNPRFVAELPSFDPDVRGANFFMHEVAQPQRAVMLRRAIKR